MSETYTEDEVNSMLAISGIKLEVQNVSKLFTLELNHVLSILTTLKDSVDRNAASSERESKVVLDELRRGEQELVECKGKIREEIFDKFIQKKDLKIYLAIVVTVVTLTTGAFQWVLAGKLAEQRHEATVQANKDMMQELKFIIGAKK